jgi:phosphatidylglycerol:prolipoprotein diacylglycerol transferase
METNEYWVHDLSPFLIEFPTTIFGIEGIRYYGVAYLLGFFAVWYFLKICEQKGKLSLNAKDRSDLMTYLILGVLIGGRLGYVLFYDFQDFIKNPFLFFRIDQGGMASHGGFIGVSLALLIFCQNRNLNSLKLVDCISVVAPLGLALGRIANFINGELWGKISTVPWAVLFPNSPMTFSSLTNYYGIQPRHPSQLYAAISEGFIPLIYLQFRFWYTKASLGQLTGEFLILYSLLRIFNEVFREPDASLIAGISRGQFYSIILLIFGISFWLYAKKKAPQIN